MINWWELAPEVVAQIFRGSGGHAGVDETAMIMAIDENLIRGEMEPEEIYRTRKGVYPVPLPGSILAYDDDFIEKLPTPDQVKEFAEKMLEVIKKEVERILDGWDRQDILL